MYFHNERTLSFKTDVGEIGLEKPKMTWKNIAKGRIPMSETSGVRLGVERERGLGRKNSMCKGLEKE